jgi:hypothetical protein
MNWRISIPHRHRSDSLTAVVDAARVLPTDEARVVRQLVLGEITGGSAATVGDLLDKLEKATPQERRKVLDSARAKAGLDTTEEIEFEQRHEQVQRNARARRNPPPRLAYNDVGLIVDLAEQEQEAARARAHEETLRAQREEREAQQAQLAAEHAEHERVRSAAQREHSRHQFPWGPA